MRTRRWRQLVGLAWGLAFGASTAACFDGALHPVLVGGSTADGADAGDDGRAADAGPDAGEPSDDNPFYTCAERSVAATTERAPEDIVIVVDNSGSMRKEADLVQTNLASMAAMLTSQGIDAHVVLVSAPYPDDPEGICVPAPLGSGSCPADSNPAMSYLHIPEVLSSSEPLKKLSECYASCTVDSVAYLWQPLIRPESTIHFVAVSDDDSDWMTAAEFTSWAAEAGLGSWVFHAIVSGDDGSQTAACAQYAIAEGAVYKTLVSQTGGVLGDLCKQDNGEFQKVFEEVANAVNRVSIACVWPIPVPEAGGEIDPDLVNVTFRDNGGKTRVIGFVPTPSDCDRIEGHGDGWYYDQPSAPTAILACPSTCTAMQNDLRGEITMAFGCKTQQAVIE